MGSFPEVYNDPKRACFLYKIYSIKTIGNDVTDMQLCGLAMCMNSMFSACHTRICTKCE